MHQVALRRQMGGSIRIQFDALHDASNHRRSIFDILTELRAHAVRKGMQDLWDQYVTVWVKDVYNKNLPVLPSNAELHLTSPASSANRLAS